MSELLTQLLAPLCVRKIRHHPQTDGLVERFNRKLKSLLRRLTYARSNPRVGRVVALLLFSFREVPQASTGFSPSYIMSVREKLADMSELVQQTLVMHNRHRRSVTTGLQRNSPLCQETRFSCCYQQVRRNWKQPGKDRSVFVGKLVRSITRLRGQEG